MEGQEENGEKLQMQTQELEQARGPISRKVSQPRAEMESRTGFNPAVAGKCNSAEVPERGQGARTRKSGDEGLAWGGSVAQRFRYKITGDKQEG